MISRLLILLVVFFCIWSCQSDSLITVPINDLAELLVLSPCPNENPCTEVHLDTLFGTSYFVTNNEGSEILRVEHNNNNTYDGDQPCVYMPFITLDSLRLAQWKEINGRIYGKGTIVTAEERNINQKMYHILYIKPKNGKNIIKLTTCLGISTVDIHLYGEFATTKTINSLLIKKH